MTSPCRPRLAIAPEIEQLAVRIAVAQAIVVGQVARVARDAIALPVLGRGHGDLWHHRQFTPHPVAGLEPAVQTAGGRSPWRQPLPDAGRCAGRASDPGSWHGKRQAPARCSAAAKNGVPPTTSVPCGRCRACRSPSSAACSCASSGAQASAYCAPSAVSCSPRLPRWNNVAPSCASSAPTSLATACKRHALLARRSRQTAGLRGSEEILNGLEFVHFGRSVT